ncbi:MAG: RNA methyltransferase, partial [Cyclobacteriaceae bacterium]|nr:RNA methyltransferase [Cyclobacteriaceae bacterium]
SEYVTEHKKGLIEQVLNLRTRFITVVLEDIYQSQNASAVVRTCDCFGIHDVHIIENENKYKLNPNVVMGASKWVDIHQYNSKKNNTEDCIEQLKESGYKIIATSPDTQYKSINDYVLGERTALVFGTEKEGLSDEVFQRADDVVRIPMYGFTESFNLSVSTALCLNVFTSQLHKSSINWQLTEKEKKEIKLEWYRNIVNKSEFLEKKYLNLKREK